MEWVPRLTITITLSETPVEGGRGGSCDSKLFTSLGGCVEVVHHVRRHHLDVAEGTILEGNLVWLSCAHSACGKEERENGEESALH